MYDRSIVFIITSARFIPQPQNYQEKTLLVPGTPFPAVSYYPATMINPVPNFLYGDVNQYVHAQGIFGLAPRAELYNPIRRMFPPLPLNNVGIFPVPAALNFNNKLTSKEKKEIRENERRAAVDYVYGVQEEEVMLIYKEYSQRFTQYITMDGLYMHIKRQQMVLM